MRIGLVLGLFTSLLSISASADTLDGALNRLDRAGSQFKGMTAQFVNVKHTAIVNEDSPSEGSIKIKKKPPSDILGLLEFVKPDKRTVVLNGKTVDVYLPNIKTVQEVDLGKHKVWVEQFFLFGFGTSKSDLQASYDVSYGGPETINGEAATRLVLMSRKPEVSRQLSKFELWISDKTGQPVQQKFYEPSGDYNVFTYSDMKINPNLPDSELEKHPKGYKKEMLNK
jgi:outer membrane lipoprotein-sorting protein